MYSRSIDNIERLALLLLDYMGKRICYGEFLVPKEQAAAGNGFLPLLLRHAQKFARGWLDSERLFQQLHFVKDDTASLNFRIEVAKRATIHLPTLAFLLFESLGYARSLSRDPRTIDLAVLKDSLEQISDPPEFSWALYGAIKRNDTARAIALIRRGEDAKKGAAEIITPLHLATLMGQTDVVEHLLRAGVCPDPGHEKRWTPLHVAASQRHAEIALKLVQAGADPMAADFNLNIPLHYAAAAGCEATVKALLRGGTNPERKDGRGLTALYRARRHGHADVILELLRHGVRLDENDLSENAPSPCPPSPPMKTLRDMWMVLKPDDTDDYLDKRTLLPWAAQNGHGEILGLLLKAGAAVNRVDDGLHQFTALQWAALEGNADLVSQLIAAGADLEIDHGGKSGTALLLAAEAGAADVIRHLIAGGANLERLKGKRNALHLAAANGHCRESWKRCEGERDSRAPA